jgi:transcriptional regulator with XRE-family HTH domain
MKGITRRLRVLRAGRNISQLDTALKVGIAERRYWEIENGYRTPTDDEIVALAKVLKCEPTDIVPAPTAEAAR